MLLIATAALLFFGPDQLPKVARRAGQVVRDVQATSQSFIREMELAADEPSAHDARPPYAPQSFHPEPYAPEPNVGGSPNTASASSPYASEPDLHLPPWDDVVPEGARSARNSSPPETRRSENKPKDPPI